MFHATSGLSRALLSSLFILSFIMAACTQKGHFYVWRLRGSGQGLLPENVLVRVRLIFFNSVGFAKKNVWDRLRAPFAKNLKRKI